MLAPISPSSSRSTRYVPSASCDDGGRALDAEVDPRDVELAFELVLGAADLDVAADRVEVGLAGLGAHRRGQPVEPEQGARVVAQQGVLLLLGQALPPRQLLGRALVGHVADLHAAGVVGPVVELLDPARLLDALRQPLPGVGRARCSNQDGVVGTSLPSLAPRCASAWARSSFANDVRRSDTVASCDFMPLFHLLRKASASGPNHVTDCTDDVIDSSLERSRVAVLSNVVANRSTSTSSAPSCAMPRPYGATRPGNGDDSPPADPSRVTPSRRAVAARAADHVTAVGPAAPGMMVGDG